MNWIKKNPAQLSLSLVSLVALALIALLYTRVSSFAGNFKGIQNPIISTGKVEKTPTETLDAARKAIETPVSWAPTDQAGKLLISELYVIQDGKLARPKGKSFQKPVPNVWLSNYNLDFLKDTVLKEDPDQDGFTTLEEWNGLDTLSHLDNDGHPVMNSGGQPLPDDSTDPMDPISHPPYHTKLVLVKIRLIPFRLRFMSSDLDLKKPENSMVQINTVDVGGRTHFVKLGDDIPKTKYKVESFKKIEVPGKDGTKKDASEVTVENKETGAKVILPLGQIVDSPDSYGVFGYKWVQPGKEGTADFSKARGQTFTLPPEPDKTYTLVEIVGKSAVITLPDGTKKTLTATQ